MDAKLPLCAAVTATGELFNHIFDAANSDAMRSHLLERIYAALAPGGTLLFGVAGRS
ncbi:MAG: hypothetical protein ACFB5Z_14175 [Elainellaceae cyanobacterium]